jgi:NTE family protein
VTGNKRKKLGLALGSGAWRGLFHVGVLKSLEEHEIPISFIAGSSAGSLIGGIYAANPDANNLEKIFLNLEYKDLLKLLFSFNRNKTDDRGGKLDLFLRKILGNQKVEESKIKFCAISSNMIDGKIIKIEEGDMVSAIIASSAIPGIFKPVEINGGFGVDGGAIMPIPVPVVKEMGAEITIGVNLYNGIFPVPTKNNGITRMMSLKLARFLPLNQLAQENLKNADFVFNPKIPNEDYGFFLNFLKNKEVIEFGKKYTDKKIPEILKALEK